MGFCLAFTFFFYILRFYDKCRDVDFIINVKIFLKMQDVGEISEMCEFQ